MLTEFFDLEVLTHGEGDIPFTPQASIYVKTYTSNERGLIVPVGGCENLEEMETPIDRLHKELEVIRQKAKREFSKI